MKKLVLLPLAVLFVLAGCQDLRKDYQIPAEAEISGPTFSIESSSSEGRSVVCIAYDERLAQLKSESPEDPKDAADHQETIKQFENYLATQCN